MRKIFLLILLIYLFSMSTALALVDPLGIILGHTSLTDTKEKFSWNKVAKNDFFDWEMYSLQQFMVEKLPFKNAKSAYITIDNQGIVQKLEISMEGGWFCSNYSKIFKTLNNKYTFVKKIDSLLGDKIASFESEGFHIDLESIVRAGDFEKKDLGDVTVFLTYKSPAYIKAEINLQKKIQDKINEEKLVEAAKKTETQNKLTQLPKNLKEAL